MSVPLARFAWLAVLALPLSALPAHATHPEPRGARGGNEIAYVQDDHGEGSASVRIRNLTSGVVTTTLPSDTRNDWLYAEPELSPDSSRLVVVTDRGSLDQSLGLAVVDRDGHSFRRLTNPIQPTGAEALDLAPAWSPDGTSILFSRVVIEDASITSSIYVVPAGGGAPRMVAGASDGYTADWDPTGQRIVYAALQDPDRGVGDLFVTPVTGTSTVDQLRLGVRGSHPAWSPDGSTIALSQITSFDDATGADIRQITTVPATGGPAHVLAATRLSDARSAAAAPSWAPDSSSLLFELYQYFSGGFPGDSDLWAVDRNGARAGRLLGGPGDQSGGSLQGPSPSSIRAGGASSYVPITPVRVLDTRSGVGAGAAAKVPAGGSVRLPLHGVPTSAGSVPASATAVILNVTVTGTTANTDVRVFPAGTPTPNVSNLNARAGETVPNLVTATLGDDGAVVLRNSGGTVHLIADLAGYYVPADAGFGDGLSVISPSRLLDTRSSAGPVGPGESVDLRVTGQLATFDGQQMAVPATATAVILNVTATGASASTDVRVHPTPADGAVPEVSNLNLRAGQTAANLVTVAVGEDGQVRLRNSAGSVHLIADLAGYYGADEPGRFVPVEPERFLDTRTATGAAPIPTGAGGHLDLKIGGSRGVPGEAVAAVLNLTGTGVTAPTDIRAYPAGAGSAPTVSSLNLGTGSTRANAAVVKTGEDGRVRIRNNSGSVHLIGDLAGYVVHAR